MPDKRQSPQTGESKRGFTLTRESINVEERRVELAFSSEIPYERYFGMEVLGHEKGEVDLSRLGDGTHPLLFNHDRGDMIGVVESARVDDDKVGRAVVRFSKSARAEEVFQDVQDGIMKQVSVAYSVNKWERVEDEDEEEEDPDAMEKWRAVSWTPFECSLVTIAADPSVGVGRQHNKTEPTKETPKMSKENEKNDSQDLSEAQAKGAKNERERVSELFKLGTEFECMNEAQKAIDDGEDARDFSIKAARSYREKKEKEAKKEKETGTKTAPEALGKETGGKSDSKRIIESVGTVFIKSDSLKNSKYRVGQRISQTVEIPDFSSFAEAQNLSRATLGWGSSFQNLTSITDLPGIVVPDRRTLRVADLFPSGPISAGSLRFLREASYTNAATRVAEGAQKPEGTFDLEQVTVTVEKTAKTARVTDEMFADFPATQGYVDNFLTYSVMQLEDTQLLTGTGTSQITGVHSVSGIGSISAASYSTVADAVDGAIEQIQTNGNVEPTAIVMHPADWHDLRRTKDSNGQYYGGGPFTGAYGNGQFSNVMSLWGLPTIATTAQTQGQILVGNFQVGAMIFRRTGLTLEATNSNEDDFEKNLISLRAEQRQCLATWKPLAFCEVTNVA